MQLKPLSPSRRKVTPSKTLYPTGLMSWQSPSKEEIREQRNARGAQITKRNQIKVLEKQITKLNRELQMDDEITSKNILARLKLKPTPKEDNLTASIYTDAIREYETQIACSEEKIQRLIQMIKKHQDSSIKSLESDLKEILIFFNSENQLILGLKRMASKDIYQAGDVTSRELTAKFIAEMPPSKLESNNEISFAYEDANKNFRTFTIILHSPHSKNKPYIILSSTTLTANERFYSIGIFNSESYNENDIKLLINLDSLSFSLLPIFQFFFSENAKQALDAIALFYKIIIKKTDLDAQLPLPAIDQQTLDILIQAHYEYNHQKQDLSSAQKEIIYLQKIMCKIPDPSNEVHQRSSKVLNLLNANRLALHALTILISLCKTSEMDLKYMISGLEAAKEIIRGGVPTAYTREIEETPENGDIPLHPALRGGKLKETDEAKFHKQISIFRRQENNPPRLGTDHTPTAESHL